MKVNLADEIEQVAMAVDEPWENGLTLDVDHAGAARNRNVAAFADGFDPLAFDDDHCVFDRWPASGIDERAAL